MIKLLVEKLLQMLIILVKPSCFKYLGVLLDHTFCHGFNTLPM